MRNHLHHSKIVIVSAGGNGTASSTPTKGTIIDMLGYEGVEFVALMGDVVNEAEVALKVAGADVNDTAEMTLLEAEVGGKATATSFDDKALRLDVFKPRQRFLEAQLFHVAENAPFRGIIAILYRSNENPVAEQDGTVVLAKTFNDPDNA